MSYQWQKYNGSYEKTEYDIMLKDGTVIKNCWPNAGQFHVLDNSWRVIDGGLVTHTREGESDE